MVGLITWIVTLRLLTAPLLGETPHTAETDSRRRDVPGARRRSSSCGVGGAHAWAARIAGSGRRQVEQARRLLRLPVKHGDRAGRGLAWGSAGIAPWRTPNNDFYVIHTALAPPSISPQDWRLRIHGMVERELTFSYQDLLDRQLTEAWVTLCCVSNEVGGDLIGNAWWSGVLVRDLIAEAGAEARRRRGPADLARRLGLRYAAGRADRPEPQRHARRRDERPAAARCSTGSRCGWWCPGSTATSPRPSGWSTSR